MLAKRITVGFHRIGVVGATLIALFALVCFGIFINTIVKVGWGQAKELLIVGAAFLFIAWAFYAAAWALGWIVAGFVGGHEEPEA